MSGVQPEGGKAGRKDRDFLHSAYLVKCPYMMNEMRQVGFLTP
jgi:hypothetical protein